MHSHTTNPFIENPGERVVQKQLLELRSAVMKGRQKQNLEIASSAQKLGTQKCLMLIYLFGKSSEK